MANRLSDIKLPYDPIFDAIVALIRKDAAFRIAIAPLVRDALVTLHYATPKPFGSIQITDQAIELYYQHMERSSDAK